MNKSIKYGFIAVVIFLLKLLLKMTLRTIAFVCLITIVPTILIWVVTGLDTWDQMDVIDEL